MKIRLQRVAGDAVYVEIDFSLSIRTASGAPAELRAAAADDEARAARILARAKRVREAAAFIEGAAHAQG